MAFSKLLLLLVIFLKNLAYGSVTLSKWFWVFSFAGCLGFVFELSSSFFVFPAFFLVYVHTYKTYVCSWWLFSCCLVFTVGTLAGWLLWQSVCPSFLLYVCLFSQFILKLVVRHIEIFYVWALIEITIYVYGSLIVCCESFKQRRFKICYPFYKMGAVNSIFYLFLSLRLQI